MKKNWKKLLALVLALVMAMSLLAACDLLSTSDKDDDDDDDIRGVISQAAQGDTTAAAQDTPIATTAAPTEATDDEPEFSLGSTATGSYENAFIGIGFRLPAGWAFYTDEQIKEQNQATAEMLDEEYAELIANAAVIYDMMAQDAATGSSVIVNLEKANALALAVLDLEDYLNNNTAMLVDALASMGCTVTETKIQDVAFAGTATKGLWIKSSYMGIDMYQLVVPVKCAGYIACVNATTIASDITAELMASFYAID